MALIASALDGNFAIPDKWPEQRKEERAVSWPRRRANSQDELVAVEDRSYTQNASNVWKSHMR